MAYTNKTIDLTGYNSKIENEGATSGGRLSATEYNTVVSALIEAQNNIQLLDQGVTIDLGGKQATLQLDQAPTSGSTKFVNSGAVYAALQAGAGDMAIEVVSSGATTLNNLLPNHYYKTSSDVATMDIELPYDSSWTTVKGLVIYLHTGTITGSISIACNNSTIPIYCYDGFEWADDTAYELNFIYTGGAWYMAYGIIATAPLTPAVEPGS